MGRKGKKVQGCGNLQMYFEVTEYHSTCIDLAVAVADSLGM